VGDAVSTGEALATIHYNEESRAALAKQLLEASCRITDSPPIEKKAVGTSSDGKAGEKN